MHCRIIPYNRKINAPIRFLYYLEVFDLFVIMVIGFLGPLGVSSFMPVNIPIWHIALWLAVERPECVDHLVLECPGGLQSIDPALRGDAEERNRTVLAYYDAEDGKDADLLENLSRVEATTLILHGTEDRIIAAESMQRLKSALRRAFLVYVWGAAHDIEVDQPGRVLPVVQSFLERSEAFVVRYA